MPLPTARDVHVSSLLTNVAVSYIQKAKNFVADQVFPIVPVEKQSDRYVIYNKSDWFRDEAAERAPGTESAGGGYDVDTTPNYFCRKYAFHKDVDDEMRTNADAPLTPDRTASRFVTQKLLIKRERMWASSFMDEVWGNNLKGIASSPGSRRVPQMVPLRQQAGQEHRGLEGADRVHHRLHAQRAGDGP